MLLPRVEGIRLYSTETREIRDCDSLESYPIHPVVMVPLRAQQPPAHYSSLAGAWLANSVAIPCRKHSVPTLATLAGRTLCHPTACLLAGGQGRQWRCRRRSSSHYGSRESARHPCSGGRRWSKSKSSGISSSWRVPSFGLCHVSRSVLNHPLLENKIVKGQKRTLVSDGSKQNKRDPCRQ